MRIALVKPPVTYADWYRHPALGIAYIASCLKSSGFDCQIFDACFHSWSQSELLFRIKNYKPDVIGLTAMTHEVKQAATIAAQLKAEMDTPAIIGGCHITALPEKTLEEFGTFDYGIYGEGENTIVELLESLQQKSTAAQLNNIKGLVFRNNGQIVINEPRPFMTSAELDSLPYPSLDSYYPSNIRALKSKNCYYVIMSSRGCPYNCAFCMRVLGRKIRRRSPQNILQEIEFAIERYGAHTINFADEIFLFDNQQTRDLLQLFIQRDIPKRIKWSALTRANFVNRDLIELAKKAGCFRLEMGVESGDDKILKAVGKGITVNQVRNAVKSIKEAGIPLCTYYILGHPGETTETLKRTADLAVELNTYSIAVGLMVPYPGTKIFQMALQGRNGYRLLSKDWLEYDKYGGRVLEIDGLPHHELVKWQKRTLLNFYLKNFRFLDCIKFLWKRRRAFHFFMKKKITLLGKKRVRETVTEP
ncbi:MAG: hypothetical protein AMJ75_05615 [Phycisphaerae bacterium SM1_79]|nr:MAG: hypothetical protein AMJ75_05615 [Phycisphaerae bacterium SM1_79]